MKNIFKLYGTDTSRNDKIEASFLPAQVAQV